MKRHRLLERVYQAEDGGEGSFAHALRRPGESLAAPAYDVQRSIGTYTDGDNYGEERASISEYAPSDITVQQDPHDPSLVHFISPPNSSWRVLARCTGGIPWLAPTEHPVPCTAENAGSMLAHAMALIVASDSEEPVLILEPTERHPPRRDHVEQVVPLMLKALQHAAPATGSWDVLQLWTFSREDPHPSDRAIDRYALFRDAGVLVSPRDQCGRDRGLRGHAAYIISPHAARIILANVLHDMGPHGILLDVSAFGPGISWSRVLLESGITQRNYVASIPLFYQQEEGWSISNASESGNPLLPAMWSITGEMVAARVMPTLRGHSVLLEQDAPLLNASHRMQDLHHMALLGGSLVDLDTADLVQSLNSLCDAKDDDRPPGSSALCRWRLEEAARSAMAACLPQLQHDLEAAPHGAQPVVLWTWTGQGFIGLRLGFTEHAPHTLISRSLVAEGAAAPEVVDSPEAIAQALDILHGFLSLMGPEARALIGGQRLLATQQALRESKRRELQHVLAAAAGGGEGQGSRAGHVGPLGCCRRRDGMIINGFWHVGAMGAMWREAVWEQYQVMATSGLLSRSCVHVTVLGDKTTEEGIDERLPLPWQDTKQTASSSSSSLHRGGFEVWQHPKTSLYEFPTLFRLWEHCTRHPQEIVFYFHSKGTSASSSSFLRVQAWRRYMDHFIIGPGYQACLEVLSMAHVIADVCGVQLREKLGSSVMYDGNFFWARCEYISGLSSPLELDVYERFTAEDWLGSHVNGTRFAECMGPPQVPRDLYADMVQPEMYVGFEGCTGLKLVHQVAPRRAT